MKTKMVVIVGLALQICFLLFFMIQVPETDGAIQVGLQRLKEEAPAQAANVQMRADGAMELKTAGDFFYIAGTEYRYVTRATLVFIVTSIFISVSFLVILRRKTGISSGNLTI